MKTTDYNSILKQIDGVDPVAYGRSRNYRNGAVTRLSPYISRGVISTKQVMENMLGRGFSLPSIEKFIQELAWRDY
ncbi:MAG: deoxyribodipyrimidine photo-lyase, partial [Psychroserpens sp.]